jgi:WD40 repeat protein
VTCGNEVALVFDAKTGAKRFVLEGMVSIEGSSSVTSASFNPDGTRIVTAGTGMVRVWNAETGTKLHVLNESAGFGTFAAFSPDGTRIVSGSENGMVRVWDSQKGVILLSIKHRSAVRSMAWSSDGSKLLVGLQDATVEIRDGGPVPQPPK